MTENKRRDDLQALTEALASVSKNSKKLEIIIFGAGLGGLAMLEVLRQSPEVIIQTIIDRHDHAPAFALADRLGIATSIHGKEVLSAFRGDIIIDVTGDAALHRDLIEFKKHHPVELISAKSAKLLFDLVNLELRSERTIENQGTRLNLLETLLDITLQLEQKPHLNEITNSSLINLHDHIQAIKGMAVIFREDGKPDYIGAVGTAAPICDPPMPCNLDACNTLRAICSRMKKGARYITVEEGFHLSCPELDSTYNLVLPLWHESKVAGALLFEMRLPLSKDQIHIIEMSSIHLNMTFKTLDHFIKLEQMAIFDALTGVFNRRKFDMQLQHEVSRIKRSKHGTLTCGFIDLDNFKTINDTYGHHTGDLVLKHIAESIESCIRDYDLCARYGGDEFVILLPSDNQMDVSSLKEIGMRILKKVSEFKLESAPGAIASVSIGLATQSSETASAEKLLQQADEALYQAKHSGKGCLRIMADEQFRFPGNHGQSTPE